VLSSSRAFVCTKNRQKRPRWRKVRRCERFGAAHQKKCALNISFQHRLWKNPHVKKCILTVNSKIRRVVNFTENTTLAHKGQQLV
jgi:hypothetical protein